MPTRSPNPPKNNQILILGVGNLLLTDEGVGIHTIRALEQQTLPSHVRLLDGGTGGFHLLSWLQEYEHIIMIDATLDENPPGTINILEPRYPADFPPLMSAHEIGLRDMIEAMMLTGDLPKIQLITVSVSNINDFSMELTPAVQAAIPKIIQTIQTLLDS